ncbi:MAG TPA: type IV pilus twitching motility protein PilT [Candidatus Polarisedimenticolaceae bacterium]|nr:type IV pilus twitching motility protein PilT [Candidatus Polarisedimenticolaceae bacterium]
MPQLDAMLRALADRGARELRLSEGTRPVFQFAEGDRPVSQAVLQRAQIVSLVTELAGKGDAARLSGGESVRFLYRTDDGKSFLCETGLAGGGFVARIVPQEASAAAVPVSPEPTAPPPPLEVRPGAPAIEALLLHMVEQGASDLHLSPGEVPMLRLHGEMVKVAGATALPSQETAKLVMEIAGPRYREEFERTHDTDFAHEIPEVARFRVNVFADRRGTGAVFRIIPSKIPSADQLGLPKAVLDLGMLSKGLVLVTGPTGSGKSTTLAALIDHVNRTRKDHVITIEDPVEFVHENKSCLINQREVGTHTDSFKRALRAALREDPDIVLVGEMRDLETIAIAIETAETGHLVFGTLHTSTAPSTVDRIIDQFPADRQAQVRIMLSESLKGVISQTLLRKIGGGRVAALEILIGIPAISNLIREGKTYQIPSIMQTGRRHGMVLLNDSLLDLVKRRVVSPEEAYLKAIDKLNLLAAMRTAGFDVPGVGPDSPKS